MLMLPASVRVFLALGPTDMRKSFDTLAALVVGVIHQDPLCGHLFVFRNRRKNRMKILYWDRTGYALWAKRLEAGTFWLPSDESGSVEIDVSDLTMIMEGIDLNATQRRKRYARPRPRDRV